MREIKFRGMSLRGTWHIGLVSVTNGETYISNSAGRPLAFQIRPETLGQLTGLTDCNDAPIFEGDILKCFINDKIIGNLDKVEFKDGAFILGYRTVTLHEWMTMPNDEYGSGLEVIGNIYQNYDLLNQ